MRCISIQQPWAFLIVQGYKDIENRNWNTNQRGQVLIHAGKKKDENFDWSIFTELGIELPSPFARSILDGNTPHLRGGIVGIATIVDVVTHSRSRWFRGPYGIVLKDARPLPFVPLRGQLYFFEVPEEIVKGIQPEEKSA